jgi:hypothetical protein
MKLEYSLTSSESQMELAVAELNFLRWKLAGA